MKSYATKSVTESLRHYYFKPKDSIPLKHDVLWQIERGVVRALAWNEDGDQMLLGLWSAGDIIGSPISTIEPYKLECLSTVAVVMLPRDSWHQTYDFMMNQLKRSEELLYILNCKSVKLRLRQFLAWLSTRFGSPLECGILINLKLTHQDIADTICTTRVTITRLLGEMKREGKISVHRDHFISLNLETVIN